MTATVGLLGTGCAATPSLPLEDLVWEAVQSADDPARLVQQCEFLLMVSVDSLDARGISCMTVGGLLHRIPEHTRIDDGAIALLLAASMVAAERTTVCLLGWEKPTDASLSSLTALAGDPHFERPLGWTAGLEERLAESRVGSVNPGPHGDGVMPYDRAVCIVLGPAAADRQVGALSVHRRSGQEAQASGSTPLPYPSPSPVAPLWPVGRRAHGRTVHALGTGQEIVVEVHDA